MAPELGHQRRTSKYNAMLLRVAPHVGSSDFEFDRDRRRRRQRLHWLHHRLQRVEGMQRRRERGGYLHSARAQRRHVPVAGGAHRLVLLLSRANRHHRRRPG